MVNEPILIRLFVKLVRGLPVGVLCDFGLFGLFGGLCVPFFGLFGGLGEPLPPFFDAVDLPFKLPLGLLIFGGLFGGLPKLLRGLANGLPFLGLPPLGLSSSLTAPSDEKNFMMARMPRGPSPFFGKQMYTGSSSAPSFWRNSLLLISLSEARGRGPAERDALGACACGVVQGVRDDVLAGPAGRAGELERVLDLVAVLVRQLREDEQRADVVVPVHGVEVPAVLPVDPRVKLGKVDLGALAVVHPVLHAGVALRLDFGRDLAGWHVGDSDAFLLRVPDLARDVVVFGCGVDGGIDALFGGTGQRAPAEFAAEDFLAILADQQPDGLQLQLFLDEIDEPPHRHLVLRPVAQGVADDDGVVVLRDVSAGGAGLFVPPDVVSLVQPGGVGGVAVVGDELCERLELLGGDVVDVRGLVLPWRVERAGFRVAENRDRRLLGQAARISVVQRGVTDVSQVQQQHDDPLEADATAAVWRGALVEALHVVLHHGRLDGVVEHALLQHLRVVDTLTAGQDFLAPQEDIERIGVVGVFGVQHGVERAGGQGELVDDVKVGVVLLLDELAQPDFSTGGQVFVFVGDAAVFLLVAGFEKHADSLLEGDSRGLIQPDEVFMRELTLDDIQLVTVSLVDAFEDRLEHVVNHVQDLVVVLFESHFQVQAGEFGQVTVGVAVLGAEDGADLVHSLEIRDDAHLLGQLRALREEGVPAEIVDLENARSGLGCGALELGCVDFDEAIAVEEGAEEIADTSRLGGSGSEIEDAVAQERPGVDMVAPAGFVVDVLFGQLGLVDGEGEVFVDFGDGVELSDEDFLVVDGGRLDRLGGLADDALDEDDGLDADVVGPLDHVLGGLAFLLLEDALDGVLSLAEDEEGETGAEFADGVHSDAEDDVFAFVRAVDIGYAKSLLVFAFLGLVDGEDAVALAEFFGLEFGGEGGLQLALLLELEFSSFIDDDAGFLLLALFLLPGLVFADGLVVAGVVGGPVGLQGGGGLAAGGLAVELFGEGCGGGTGFFGAAGSGTELVQRSSEGRHGCRPGRKIRFVCLFAWR
ncbi:hypothetical protein Dda_5118 [Drechslerella dactyloides]|uniref:Uncharacterized protein n=1 Tax=Drechslerella dactyloides TaxID=74499 RepID=A0AAD6NH87_DREDA|nr:hypothetical protein Dda_5118 [Drechslerella dactyloides]